MQLQCLLETAGFPWDTHLNISLAHTGSDLICSLSTAAAELTWQSPEAQPSH